MAVILKIHNIVVMKERRKNTDLRRVFFGLDTNYKHVFWYYQLPVTNDRHDVPNNSLLLEKPPQNTIDKKKLPLFFISHKKWNRFNFSLFSRVFGLWTFFLYLHTCKMAKEPLIPPTTWRYTRIVGGTGKKIKKYKQVFLSKT